ncbi:alpha/beta hydrolase [Methylobacterium sp. ARG-1]|uniref:alpha/beta hydrolase n=1 Tax=Methylobacterium sp. ARG-1 TaxID=1692501 RepID=UPI000B229E23|nr:alpha/beta hydrolase [Methylobacterium sp. ARG-1]
MKIIALPLAILLVSVSITTIPTQKVMAQDMSNGANNFYESKELTVQKVSFKSQYNMKVVGNLYTPKNLDKKTKSAAIIVGHPMGAVKEQSSNLYAQKLAERGFVTLSIDLSFWGESEGEPRNAVLPDVYAEDFSAAVDYLGSQSFIDKERIGVLGICGSGSFSISAAKIDPRMKAIATVSMYDMGGATRSGINNSQSLEQRKEMLAQAAEQRYAEFQGGKTKWLNYLPKKLPDGADPVSRDFHDFYRTERGEFVPKGIPPEQSQNRAQTQEVKFVNFYPFNDIETISPRPMLFIAGEKAHSLGFSQEAYELAGEPKELLIVPGATHVDLYDRVNVIPFDKLTEFFRANLK